MSEKDHLVKLEDDRASAPNVARLRPAELEDHLHDDADDADDADDDVNEDDDVEIQNKNVDEHKDHLRRSIVPR